MNRALLCIHLRRPCGSASCSASYAARPHPRRSTRSAASANCPIPADTPKQHLDHAPAVFCTALCFSPSLTRKRRRNVARLTAARAPCGVSGVCAIGCVRIISCCVVLCINSYIFASCCVAEKHTHKPNRCRNTKMIRTELSLPAFFPHGILFNISALVARL